MIRLCALLSLGLFGCGISASTRSAIREPGKLSAVLPADAQLVVKAGADEIVGAGSAAGAAAFASGPGLIFSPIAFGIGAALESQREISRVDASTKLGIADPAQGLSKTSGRRSSTAALPGCSRASSGYWQFWFEPKRGGDIMWVA